METKHTEGKWVIEDGIRSFRIVTEGSFEIAEVKNAWRPFKTNLANAKLIAAAPELLEACITVLEALEATQNSRNFMAPKLRAAIKKAIK